MHLLHTLTLSFVLILSFVCCSSPDNWGLVGAPLLLGLYSKGQKDSSVNLPMLEELHRAVKWFTADLPQGEDHRKIQLHIHKQNYRLHVVIMNCVANQAWRGSLG